MTPATLSSFSVGWTDALIALTRSDKRVGSPPFTWMIMVAGMLSPGMAA